MRLIEPARGYLETGLARPHQSLEAALEARLLELPVEDRRVLRAASAIGVRSPRRGVIALLRDPVDVDAATDRLRRAGILQPVSPRPADALASVFGMDEGGLRVLAV